jgi:hypothetical protein
MKFEQVDGIIRWHLGGNPPPTFSTMQIANSAGDYLCSVRAWKWLEMGSTTLNLVASQVYVDLPGDFREFLGYNATNSLVNSLELTSLQRLLDLKTNQVEVSNWNFFGAVTHPSASPPVPRLEIWPTPDSNDTGALTIYYRRGWLKVAGDTETDSDEDDLKIPPWMEPLYLEYVKAFAKAYVEPEEGSLSELLVLIDNGPIMRAAERQDSSVQVDYGYMTGGSIQMIPRHANKYLRTSVAGPS